MMTKAISTIGPHEPVGEDRARDAEGNHSATGMYFSLDSEANLAYGLLRALGGCASITARQSTAGETRALQQPPQSHKPNT